MRPAAEAEPRPAEILASVLRDDPEPLERINPAVPVRLSRAIGRCLAKSPADRFPTAANSGF